MTATTQYAGICSSTKLRQYITRSDAKTVARSTGTNTHNGEKVKPFPCAACGYFHVGTTGGMSRAANRAIHTTRHVEGTP